MPIKNIKALLTQATNFPAAIEAKLPEGAPKISTMLLDAADKIPQVPDFPMELPDLPAPPELPEMPGSPELKRYVTRVEVRPTPAPTPRPIPASPVGPSTVIERRGI